jgi:hypothetical protein
VAYPSPPPQPPPWSPPRPRSTRPLIIGLAIGLPALLLIVLAAALASSSDDSGGPNEVGERFIEAINRGDIHAARAELCQGVELFPMTLAEVIDSEPAVALVDPLEDYVPGFAGSDLGRVQGTSATGSGFGTIAVVQYEADGPWCVDNFIFAPDSVP